MTSSVECLKPKLEISPGELCTDRLTTLNRALVGFIIAHKISETPCRLCKPPSSEVGYLFGHRPKCFWNDRKKLCHFGQTVWKYRL